jgi:hypothetical protein
MKEQNENLLQIVDLCKSLLECADQGDMIRKDDCCGVLYGIVRDCAYRILEAASREKTLHIRMGIWEPEE